jgi:hypothetical protein
MKTQLALLSITAALVAATLGADAPEAEEASATLSPQALQAIAQVEAEIDRIGSDRLERARKGKKRPRGAPTPSIFWIRAILNSPLRLSTGFSPSNVIATPSQKSRQSHRRPDEATGPDQDQHHG